MGNHTESRSKRELEHLKDPVKINHLLKQYLNQKSVFLKGTEPPVEVRITGVGDPNKIFLEAPKGLLEEEETYKLFRILGRYIELEGPVIEKAPTGTSFVMVVEKASIAKKERQAMRIGVKNDDVYITNIRTSKSTIDATAYKIPTSVKVTFATFEQDFKNNFDDAKIEAYGKRGTIFDEMRKSGKYLLITDTQDPEAYKPAHEACLDYKDYLEDNLQRTIWEYKQKQIISELAVPVTYISHDESAVPLGYILLSSKTRAFNMDDAIEMQGKALEMVDRIRDSNTVLVQERQRVLNFSRGGLKVAIDHDDLRDYLVRQNGFTFDLFFRGQAPVTLYGLIRSTTVADPQTLVMGVNITGSSSRDGEMKRFMDNVAVRERQLKEALAKRQRLMGKK